MGTHDGESIPLQISRNCVVASIQVDLSDRVLARFRVELLELLHRSGAEGVILEVSGISIMDERDFEALRSTMAMARVMGARSILAGLQPGVVSSLVELGLDTSDVVAALDLDDAFRIMETLPSGANEDDENEPPSTAPADPF